MMHRIGAHRWGWRRPLATALVLLAAPRSLRAEVEGAPTGAPPALPGARPTSDGVIPPAPTAEALLQRLRQRVARPGGLTAGQAAARAIATSTDDRSRAADVDSAESEVDRAKVGYYPRLNLTARYTRLSPLDAPQIGPITLPVVLDQYLLQANVLVPLSDYLLRIRQGEAAATHSREAAERTREAVRRGVAMQAKVAYYAWARARMQQAVTEQAVAQSLRHLELSRAAHDAGRLPDVEVLRAESLLSSAELLDERTKNAGLLAEQRLRTLMHDEGSQPLEIGEDLLSPVEAGDVADVGAPEALYAEALRNRPELRAIARSEDAVREQRRVAAATRLPRLDGFGNAYVANPNQRVFPQEEKWRATWDVGVQVTWSPNDLGTANATTRSVDARAKRLDAERAALADAVRDEISGGVLAWKEARFAAKTAERGLTAAEEAYRVRRELSELGRGTSVELVDAETDVLRARLEMIQARVDARIARVRLDHAVGKTEAIEPVATGIARGTAR